MQLYGNAEKIGPFLCCGLNPALLLKTTVMLTFSAHSLKLYCLLTVTLLLFCMLFKT